MAYFRRRPLNGGTMVAVIEIVLYVCVWALVLGGIGYVIWHTSDTLPFGFWQFWHIRGSLWEAVIGAWPIYLWGAGLTALVAFTRWNGYTAQPIHIFTKGFLVSLLAGVLEEIWYRWLIFFLAILMIPVMDYLLLGFWGLHGIQWIYVAILCPIANFFTLGYLEPYLLNGHGWAVSAAIISANGRFRNAHKYLGPFGYVNSWFLGVYFFWVMFNYGIVVAMIIHFLYDLFIFTVPAIDAVLENRLQAVRRRRA
ncbi:hypothetical protein HYT05_03820 [Candidatus Kaiserbacteria bacterium]|nr:hypothetical protein [Candidatus Kaiserbacteria bacterium]